MKFKCPSCGCPFDSLGLPAVRVECPNCHTPFHPQPLPQSRRNLYSSDVEEAAGALLAQIRELVSDSSDGIKQCVLFHLEAEWLGQTGHKVTIKLGPNNFVNHERCSVCGKDFSAEGLALFVISRWRNTTAAVHLCEEHKASTDLYETDVDICKDNICPRMGVA